MEFKNETTRRVVEYIREQYGVEPEFLWAKGPNNAAFRHANHRWFGALLLDTPRRVLGLPGEDGVDILDLKCDPPLIGALLDGARYLPGYHMNKEHWITAVLDGHTDLTELKSLIDRSYTLTSVKKSSKNSRL